MSSWAAEIRRREAARRRQEREAHRRHKDLERRVKEQARLSELEQARLEVELHEDALEELSSIHKESGTRIDWVKHSVALPPPEPLKAGRHEFAARLAHCVAPPSTSLDRDLAAIEAARLLDEQVHKTDWDNHAHDLVEWTRMCSLAKRVLAGQAQAYQEAVTEFAAFPEVPLLGEPIRVMHHGAKLVECTLAIKGREVVPAEAKALTASGKLSSKAMPKARAQEIYQGYACGCVLRVAREMFGLLPVNEVLLTATVNGTDDRTGNQARLPVLSVAIKRAAVEKLNFERLDPFEAVQSFAPRGDAKAARRSGEFIPIVPLTAQDLAPTQPERLNLSKLLTSVRQSRAEITAKLKPVVPTSAEDAPEEQPPTI